MAIFDEIARTRRELAGYLSALDEPDWASPTLCSGWTVREVAGHLIMPLVLSRPQMLAAGAKAGFRFHRIMDMTAREQAMRPTAEIVRILREKAGHRFVPPLADARASLLDVTVHHMDIRWPRKDPPEVDPSVALTLLNFLVTGNVVLRLANPFRFAGVRLETEDLKWSHGDGPPVRGRADAMILAMFGRQAGLDRLSGDGVSVLRSRMK